MAVNRFAPGSRAQLSESGFEPRIISSEPKTVLRQSVDGCAGGAIGDEVKIEPQPFHGRMLRHNRATKHESAALKIRQIL